MYLMEVALSPFELIAWFVVIPGLSPAALYIGRPQ